MSAAVSMKHLHAPPMCFKTSICEGLLQPIMAACGPCGNGSNFHCAGGRQSGSRQMAPPKGALWQWVKFVEQGGYDNWVYGHQEDLQPKDEGPQVQHHPDARVLQDVGECSDDRRAKHQPQQHLQQTCAGHMLHAKLALAVSWLQCSARHGSACDGPCMRSQHDDHG